MTYVICPLASIQEFQWAEIQEGALCWLSNMKMGFSSPLKFCWLMHLDVALLHESIMSHNDFTFFEASRRHDPCLWSMPTGSGPLIVKVYGPSDLRFEAYKYPFLFCHFHFYSSQWSSADFASDHFTSIRVEGSLANTSARHSKYRWQLVDFFHHLPRWLATVETLLFDFDKCALSYVLRVEFRADRHFVVNRLFLRIF